MADVKISELPALTSISGADEFVVNDGGTTKKITSTNLLGGFVTKTGTNGAANIPTGTTAQRPSAAVGLLRHNSTLNQFEGYNDGAWGAIGGGGSSLGEGSIIRTNAKVIAENITFAGNENGSTVGPVTVNNNYTVTVTNGSTWIIL